MRINRSRSLLRLFGAGLLKFEGRDQDPIGASQDWHWHAYFNSTVESEAPDRIGERRHALGRGTVDQLEDLARFAC